MFCELAFRRDKYGFDKDGRHVLVVHNVGTIQIRPRLCKRRRFIFSEKPCRCYLHCRYSLVSRLEEKRGHHHRGVFKEFSAVLVCSKQEKKIPRIHKVRITRWGENSHKWRQFSIVRAMKYKFSTISDLIINLLMIFCWIFKMCQFFAVRFLKLKLANSTMWLFPMTFGHLFLFALMQHLSIN